MPIKKPAMSGEFLRFLIAGGVAAIVNYATRFVLNEYYDYTISIVIAYLLGMITAFLIMRRNVFPQSESSLGKQAGKFILVNAFALLQTLSVSLVMTYWMLPFLGITTNVKAIGHLFGIIVPVITSYYGHKHFTYR